MMRVLPLFLILLLSLQGAHALTITVEGNYVGEKIVIRVDKPAFVILRMNNGTPIYANGTTVCFTPSIQGKLYIEAISGDERASKVVEIVEKPTGGSEAGGIGDYYLPEGTVTLTINGETVSVDYRTALGILIKASKERGFDLTIKKWDYGLFVDCIKGVCTGDLGKTSGWMYSINGEIPGVSADKYKLNAGDKVIWYFSRSMSETPETSPYRITLKTYGDWTFDVSMYWNPPSGGGGGTKATTTQKQSWEHLTQVNLTIPLKIKVNETASVKVESVKQAGIKFFNLHAYVLESFNINVNKTVPIEIEFPLSKDTLVKYNASPNDVFLAKFDKNWIFIPTNYTENETHYIFETKVYNTSLFAIVIKWKDFPLNITDERIQRALDYLKGLQKEDGGFGNPDDNSSIAATVWAVMALVSAGENPHEIVRNNKSPIDYLRDNIKDKLPKMGTTDFARLILALVYAGENPRNFAGVDLVEKLKDEIKEDGQIGDYVYTTIWGIIALISVGEDVNKSVEWLKSQQNEDGGFPWAVSELSDYDDTAAAIQALIAAGVPRDSDVIQKALDYLKTGQNDDGGMRYFGTSSSNAASDSWTIQALVAAGINPVDWTRNNTSVLDHLLSLQERDGHFKYTKFVTDNPGYMTVCAIMALLGKPHPIKVAEFINITVSAIETTTVTTTPTTTIVTTTETVTETVTETKTPGFPILLVILSILIALRMRR